ncbi:MAG: hypothetical protein M1539_04395 [Actinobacteria bacterium]|nr:hypothetical protein [Actinomycetota bacterium]MCL5883198.1 hypothetical protein [Actinomycetota bacterium]
MGSLTEDLARHAQINVVNIGGLHLVATTDIATFLDTCQTENVLVIGIEGFRLEGERVLPDINAIADFSHLSNSIESIVEARRFFDAVDKPGMVYDFTLSMSTD